MWWEWYRISSYENSRAFVYDFGGGKADILLQSFCILDVELQLKDEEIDCFAVMLLWKFSDISYCVFPCSFVHLSFPPFLALMRASACQLPKRYGMRVCVVIAVEWFRVGVSESLLILLDSFGLALRICCGVARVTEERRLLGPWLA